MTWNFRESNYRKNGIGVGVNQSHKKHDPESTLENITSWID